MHHSNVTHLDADQESHTGWIPPLQPVSFLGKNLTYLSANLPVLAPVTGFTLFRFGVNSLHQTLSDIGKINGNLQIGKEARLQFPVSGQAQSVAFDTGQGPFCGIGMVNAI